MYTKFIVNCGECGKVNPYDTIHKRFCVYCGTEIFRRARLFKVTKAVGIVATTVAITTALVGVGLSLLKACPPTAQAYLYWQLVTSMVVILVNLVLLGRLQYNQPQVVEVQVQFGQPQPLPTPVQNEAGSMPDSKLATWLTTTRPYYGFGLEKKFSKN